MSFMTSQAKSDIHVSLTLFLHLNLTCSGETWKRGVNVTDNRFPQDTAFPRAYPSEVSSDV